MQCGRREPNMWLKGDGLQEVMMLSTVVLTA